MIDRGMLETWLAPLDLETFRRDYLSRRTLFREASPARFETVARAHSWQVDELLHDPGVKALAWFEGRDGRHLTADVTPENARKLHRGGLTLYLQDLSALAPVGDAIAGALRVPRENVKCTLFCNRPGATTRAHFDPVDTITMQLRGRKRWRVAPNALAPQPTTSWATLDGSGRKAELWLYAHDELPSRIPDGAEEYLLEPGAVLNVPRGFWHETDSDEDSVSLHIHHVPLPWVDAVLVTLRAHLLREMAWREPANLLWDSRHLDDNERTLGRLLDSLTEAAGQITIDDVLPTPRPPSRPPGPRDPLRRRARSGFVVEARERDGDEAKVTFVTVEYGTERRTTVEMSRPFVDACRRFAESPAGGPLSTADLARIVPGLGEAEAAQLVALLLDVGFLRPA
jgi:50S ribosomal protein L16 3-hydroxylase